MSRIRTIQVSTAAYESWLAKQGFALVAADLTFKHQQMAGPTAAALKGMPKPERKLALAAGRFSFFRGTFYRWAELWPGSLPKLNADEVPSILAVGDLHVENFGTWRDAGHQLIWGINDFDEAHPMPFTCDLVRLVTSALLSSTVVIEPEAGVAAIAEGYRHGLGVGGRPLVLGHASRTLIEMCLGALKNPPKYWSDLESAVNDPQFGVDQKEIPAQARRALGISASGARSKSSLVSRRRAGMGSLGRQRYVALRRDGERYHALEAKAVVPSAWAWATDSGDRNIYYETIEKNAVRASTPEFEVVDDQWVVRQLGPDRSKISLSGARIEEASQLLYAMGWETANVHLGSGAAAADDISDWLKSAPPGWLFKAARTMLELVDADFEQWREDPRTARLAE